MTNKAVNEALDVAMLPLADGRRLMMPMAVLAEVKQIPSASRDATEHPILEWRGHNLAIKSLDEECGLPAPDIQRQRIVGIFRADNDSEQPFRALAFCGTAAHGLIKPDQLVTTEKPAQGNFAAAAELDGELYLIPDLPKLMYS